MGYFKLISQIIVINIVVISVVKYIRKRLRKHSLETVSVPKKSTFADLPSVESTDDVPVDTHFGLITDLFNDYGLIDRKHYFEFNVVHSQQKPVEGRLVMFTARRTSNDDNLVAEKVEFIDECWEEDAPQPTVHIIDPKDKITLGKVTEITAQGICWINNDFCIDFNETELEDHRPYVGDWVKVECLSGELQFKYKLNLVRRKDIFGTVTRVDENLIVIDDSIYCLRSVCDCLPCVGDTVKGVAVENNFQHFEWRAVHFVVVEMASDRLYQKYLTERRQVIGQLVMDKNGISITSPLDFNLVSIGSTRTITATIKNNSTTELPIPICSFENNCQQQLQCSPVTNYFNRSSNSLAPGDEARVEITCTPMLIGTFRYKLTFYFKDFQVARLVVFKSEDKRQELIQYDPSHKGFMGNLRRSEWRDNQIMNGVSDTDTSCIFRGKKVESGNRVRMPVYILKHPIPKELLQCHLGTRNILSWQPGIDADLNWRNYKSKFSTLLHLEEIQELEDMNQFNMERVILEREGTYFRLEVPGLSEGRPSVLVGDSVRLTFPDQDASQPIYEGNIHVVRNNELLLDFHHSFHDRYLEPREVNIDFLINRTTFRRCHQAVHLFTRIGSKVLFPTASQPKPAKIKFNRKNIINPYLNQRQLRAVRAILEGRQRPSPYIIYGPPGTGKTVTVIEAILQVFLCRSDSRILVCAPSNSAADLLCERLHFSGRVTTGDLVRLIAAHRLNKDLPSGVKEYSHSSLPLEVMFRYRIIVSTCSTSGILYQMGIKPGHFTHVFIDEAGQATECETLIPISVCAAQSLEDFQMILAGDPQQLGPVIRSKLACNFGLQKSFLERLCKTCLYLRDENQEGNYNPHYVTKLINNYRSHPAIIQVPSKLFYHMELVPKGSPTLTHSLLTFPCLSCTNTPIIFHGIRGDDFQEYDSPSWFNPHEIIQVITYLQLLYEQTLMPSDIGIITPYRKQVEKIKMMMKSLDIESPKIGSVEEFQGQERKAMIVSTVRSSDDWLLFDQNNGMGFLSNPKRFNVTVTRAHALLIIVGNPFILIKDFCWRNLLNFCLHQNAYVGVDEEDLRLLMATMQNE